MIIFSFLVIVHIFFFFFFYCTVSDSGRSEVRAQKNYAELSNQITRLLIHTVWFSPGNFQTRQPDHSQPFLSAFVLSPEHTFLHFKIVVHLQIYEITFPLKIIA